MEITLEMAVEKITSPERAGRAKLTYEWGMWEETKKTYFPWTDAEFAILEEKTGCVVPRQLEALLRKYATIHVGNPDPYAPQYDAFLADWPDGSQTKHAVKTLIDRHQTMLDSHFIFRHDKALPDRFPHQMIFFGDADGGHSVLLMNGTDVDDNAVYLWMMAGDPWGEGDNTHGIAKCADTLYEFMYNLTLEENL